MSSVVFLNRFYWPDMAATAQQLTDLAEDLASAGVEVSVVASRGGYAGSTPTLPGHETRNGVRIVRLPTTRFGRARIWGRVADYLSYILGLVPALLRLPRPDVVVACSDPPFVLAPALLVARLRGCKLVYNARDIYPHLAARLGVVREHGFPYRALDRLARSLHARCDAVITLGPGMGRTLTGAGAPPERTGVIPDGVDTRSIEPVPRERNPLLPELDLEGRFVVLYSGNAGWAHCFDAVIGAARLLRDDPEIVFLFIGGGRKRADLEATARAEGLGNVRFMDYLPREQLRYSLSMANVSLVTERPEVAGLLLPCKTYGILASGRPLIFIGSEQSDVAGIVRETECGYVVRPGDSAGLASVIGDLRADPERAAALGARSRRAAETAYDRSVVADRWRESLERILSSERAPDAVGVVASAVPVTD